MALIHALLPSLMEDIGVIGKNGKHQQGYKFRSIDDVINHLHPLLIKHRISTSMRCEDLQTSTTKEAKAGGGERVVNRTACRVIVNLYAEDGSTVEFSGVGIGQDYNDSRDGNKAMAAGFKYALGHGLCIPFVGVEDNDESPKPETEVEKTVDILAMARQQEAAAQQAGQAVGQPSPYSVETNGPCSQAQCDRVIGLAQKIGMPIESIKVIVGKRIKHGTNVPCQRLAELTDGQIREVLIKLEAIAREKDIPF